MIPVSYPPPDFKVLEKNGRTYIFDALRRRWLLLQEEEWVRQNFIAYLLKTLHYPPALVAQEKEILLGTLKKRFDILVYNAHHRPWMLVECKAPAIPLTEAVLHQVLRYHIILPAAYLVITNGAITRCWARQNGSLHELQQMPAFPATDG